MAQIIYGLVPRTNNVEYRPIRNIVLLFSHSNMASILLDREYHIPLITKFIF